MATHKLRLRTFLIPALMILVHMLVIQLTASLYVEGYSLARIFLDLPALPAVTDPSELIIRDYPRISVFYALILIPLYSLILFSRRLGDPDAVWLRRPKARDVGPALIIAVGMLGVTNLLFSALMALQDVLPAVDRLMADYLEQTAAFSPEVGYFWLIAGIAVLAPVSEELLFRGIIQGEMRKAMPEWLAVILQAALFALFHLQPVQILYVFLPALALGALYAWTRSLWIPILMHITFNFLGSAVPAMVGNDERLSQVIYLVEVGFAVLSLAAIVHLWRGHRRSARI
jgi:membrane protease YdiL (CAAX protease family)